MTKGQCQVGRAARCQIIRCTELESAKGTRDAAGVVDVNDQVARLGCRPSQRHLANWLGRAMLPPADLRTSFVFSHGLLLSDAGHDLQIFLPRMPFGVGQWGQTLGTSITRTGTYKHRAETGRSHTHTQEKAERYNFMSWSWRLQNAAEIFLTDGFIAMRCSYQFCAGIARRTLAAISRRLKGQNRLQLWRGFVGRGKKWRRGTTLDYFSGSGIIPEVLS